MMVATSTQNPCPPRQGATELCERITASSQGDFMEVIDVQFERKVPPRAANWENATRIIVKQASSASERPMSRVLIIGNDTQVSREIGSALTAADFPMEYSEGYANTLQLLRQRSFGVVVTHPDSTVAEDLALLEEMRAIRPGVKSIVLARQSTPDELIAALRARVFACFTPPFDTAEIANLARVAASDSQWRDDMQVITAKPGWVSVRVNCRLVTAERLMTFARELSGQLP